MKNLNCFKNKFTNFATLFVYDFGGNHEVKTEEVKPNETVPSHPVKPDDTIQVGEKAEAKVAGILNASAANAVALDTGVDKPKKPDLDLSTLIPGGNREMTKKPPQDVAEKLIAKLREKLGREPYHGTQTDDTINGTFYLLLIDENHDPKERYFTGKGNDAMDAAGKTTAEGGIREDKLPSKDDYTELKLAPQKLISEAENMQKKSQGRSLKHEEHATIFDAQDYEYVVFRDETKGNKPYRVFKSNKTGTTFNG